MKKIVFKPDQRVQIINPEIFIRCGYNLTKKDGLNMISDEDKATIAKIIGGRTAYNLSFNGFDGIYDKVLDEIAYSRIKEKSFGGSERKIFTELKEKYRNQFAYVNSKRIVKTGKYEAGYTSGWEQPEYNPPFLGAEKSNIILNLGCEDWGLSFEDYSFEIEEKNVILAPKV
jgi:hypothetical protein